MKKFLTVLLTFTLYFNLTTQANAAVGGWDLKNPVAQGASTVYDATKNAIINGKKYIKESSVKITPPASQVAKVLARGAAGYALSVAVEQLLGSVDWVLDPANNQIKYSDPNTANPNTFPKLWVVYGHHDSESAKKFGSGTPQGACQNIKAIYGQGNYRFLNNKHQCSYSGSSYADIVQVANPNYDPDAAEQEQKTLPLDVVAQQVISNANAGDASAQQATTAAAADIVAEAETDNTKARPIVSQAEANATTKPADAAEAEKANEAQGEAKPNEANPEATDLSITFPIFCNWAPTICEAAQTVISFPNTLTDWWESANQKADDWVSSISEAWTSVKDWAKSEKQDDTELDIPEQELPDIDTDIAFGGSCPSDREAEVNMGVGIIKLPISYEPICTTVSTAKPVLIFVGFFIAALIIGGVKTE
ncbi:virulence factor TspB C-terminal domain-related protein [Acinetobacter radioresistens]|uniref:virulence factor TspB C-terminal domain-related protein n=1 Tax=Acinetobacter radioresistens TaxID=40216 RepID=UPI00124C879C|nr:virulence factor TspB C-terminal domain-related protein [Acinetobacter radioresistens]